MKQANCLVGFAVLTLLLTSCARQDDHEFIFTYSHEQPLGSIRSQSMVFFKEGLEKRTDGRIQVDLFFGGVLGDERELMDMVATGVLQGTRGGFFADANPKFNLLTMPFLVDGWDQAMRLVNSEFMHRINADARHNGWHIPATGISQGFRAHTNNVRPIRSPDDLNGLKMRVPLQDVFVRTALAFGANPQEIPAVEIYQALQTGVVDGQDNPPSNIWDYNIYEVQDFMTVTHYSTGPDPFIVDLDWYENLPEDLQLLFDAVAVEAIQYSDELNQAAEEAMIRKLGEVLQVNFLSGDELKPFQELALGVYDHFVDQGVFTTNEILQAKAIARGKGATVQ